jgi:hypothetical protein
MERWNKPVKGNIRTGVKSQFPELSFPIQIAIFSAYYAVSDTGRMYGL